MQPVLDHVTGTCQERPRARSGFAAAAASLARAAEGFQFIASDKNTATPGRQLQVRLAASPRSYDWHVPRPRACQCSLPVHICSGRVLTVKPRLSLNFNFEICDSALKLEFIGINLQANLNLNFRSKPEFKLTLQPEPEARR